MSRIRTHCKGFVVVSQRTRISVGTTLAPQPSDYVTVAVASGASVAVCRYHREGWISCIEEECRYKVKETARVEVIIWHQYGIMVTAATLCGVAQGVLSLCGFNSGVHWCPPTNQRDIQWLLIVLGVRVNGVRDLRWAGNLTTHCKIMDGCNMASDIHKGCILDLLSLVDATLNYADLNILEQMSLRPSVYFQEISKKLLE